MNANNQQPHPGCFNRGPFLDKIKVMDGPADAMDYMEGYKVGLRQFRVKWIAATGSKECHINEPRCAGCKWLNS